MNRLVEPVIFSQLNEKNKKTSNVLEAKTEIHSTQQNFENCLDKWKTIIRNKEVEKNMGKITREDFLEDSNSFNSFEDYENDLERTWIKEEKARLENDELDYQRLLDEEDMYELFGDISGDLNPPVIK